jgi:predicted dienelactone hydrolase
LQYEQWLQDAATSDAPIHGADPRVAAVVAAVPLAAIFDPASGPQANTHVAFIAAGRDRILNPELHARALLDACPGCTLLANFPEAGHMSILSPWPTSVPGNSGGLMEDPP